MRKHFLILMLLSLLPLAGWADPTLTVTLSGNGIETPSSAVSVPYKGTAYDPIATVKWGENVVEPSSVVWTKVVSETTTTIQKTDLVNADTYTVTATYTPEGGYGEQTATATLTITKIAVSISANNLTKTYGEADSKYFVNGTYPVTISNGVIQGETLDYTVARATANAATTNVGTYDNAIEVTLGTGAVNNNYTITRNEGQLKINPKQVTITAKDKSITYGANTPTTTLDFDVEGLVDANGNAKDKSFLKTTSTDITTAIALAVTVPEGSLDANSQKLNVGNYTIAVTAPVGANYDFQVTNGTLTVVKANLYVKVKNESIVFGEANPAANDYRFVYVDGLKSAAEVNAFTEAGLEGTTNVTLMKTGEGTIFTNEGAPTITYNVETPAAANDYTVSASGLTAANYNVIISNGTLTITQKSINEAVLTNSNYWLDGETHMDVKYRGGAELKPVITATLGGDALDITDTDNFEITYYNNTNAKAELTALEQAFKKQVGESQVALADNEITFPYVKVAAKSSGNYSGSARLAFTIAKAPLTIKANDTNVTLGGTPNYTATVGVGENVLLESNASAIKTALEAGQAVDGFTGALQYSVYGASDVGEYDIEIVENSLTADNYTITTQAGILNVTPGTLPLKVVVTNNGEYGTAVTAEGNLSFAFNAEGEGASSISELVRNNVASQITGITYTIKNAENVVQNDWAKLAAGTYTVSATATSNNYTVNVADAQLTVAPKKLTITIVDQEVNLFDETGATPVQNSLYEGDDAVVNLNAVYYVNDDTNDAYNGYDSTHPNGYTIKVEGLQFEDNIASLNFADKLVATVSTVGTHTDAITYEIASGKTANTNYDYTTNLTKGKLTIKGLNEDATGVNLTMENVAAKIVDYDQQTGLTVKVTFDPTVNVGTGTSQWKAEKWYTMVLPFATTVKDLSAQIGYAIVNVVNPTATTANNIKFKLTMGALPANEPFMIKTSEDITASKQLTFTNVKIEKATTPSVNAGNGYKLFGTYGTKEITNADQDLYFLYYWSDENKTAWTNVTNDGTTVTIHAFNAWADLSPAEDPQAVVFTFEELDGTTTAIKATEFGAYETAKSAEGWYNLNGVKMQGAPTQKGIYIQNGKKVIIK